MKSAYRHRCPQESLLALPLTCKQPREIAELFLWAVIEMDQECEGSVGDLVRALAAITRRAELGHHVKLLSFWHYDVNDVFSKPFTETAQRGMSNVPDWDETRQIAALLDRLPQLQSLKLIVEKIVDYFHVFKPCLVYLSGFPLELQSITELTFH
jgi:hypothetical protein